MANVITTVLKLDAANLKTGLKQTQQQIKETDGLVNKAKVGWKGMFASFASSPAAVGVATAAVGTFAAASVNAASDLNESINAVNVTFGDSADKILEFGQNAAKSAGLAAAEFNQLATPLGSILKNSGVEDFADQTIVLTQRAADMASVFNVDVSEALTAIQAGLRGEQDPLEKFGVGLSAAKVEARALADTGKDTVKSLTAQEKALARIEIILDQTNQTAGDFANTSDGLANQTRILKAEFTNLQAAAGQVLIPVLSDVAEVLLGIADAAEFAKDKINEIPGGGSFLNDLFSGIPDIARDAKQHLRDLEEGLGFTVPQDVGPLREQFNAMVAAANAANEQAAATKQAALEMGHLGAQARDAHGAYREARTETDGLADATGDLGGAARNAADDWNVFEDGLRKSADIVDFVTGKINDLRGVLDLTGQIDDINQGFADVEEAAKDATDPEGARKYRDEMRRLQGQLLDMVDQFKDLSQDKRVEIIAQIRTGDLDTLRTALDELTQDRFVNIIPIVAHDAFQSANVSFNPSAGTITPTFQGVTPAPNAPVSTDARTIINYFPVGTTPTTQYQNDQIDARRNGPR